MSSIPTDAPATGAPRRIRHQARESLAVMVLSAALSGGLAATLTLVASLTR
jgi:hypothetical protein